MKGLIIPCPNKYEKFCLENIFKLIKYGCNLPIEIWEIGNEISPNFRKLFQNIKNITFKNVNDYCDNPNHWRGFQVKAFAIYHTSFDEFILCDADVTFYGNPEFLFQDQNYIRTGAYFFKDLDSWKFYNLSYNITEAQNKFSSLDFYEKRRNFIKKLLPTKPHNFPSEWNYLYEDIIPNGVKEALQESGVVYMNKNKHKDSIEHIYQLNNNHEETYKYVWGDKETFWLGCLMANLDFYFNPVSGFWHDGCLTHSYNNLLLWKQK
jgi:hypothetical protein